MALGAALILPSASEEATRAIPTAQPAAPVSAYPAKEDMDLAWRLMHRWARAVNALDAETIGAFYAADAELHVGVFPKLADLHERVPLRRVSTG